MPRSFHFILFTLILAVGVFAGVGLERFPFLSPFWWLGPILLLSIGLSGLLKHFSSYYLFLALPLAAFLAFAAGNRVWPPSSGSIPPRTETADGLVPVPLGADDTLPRHELYAPPGTRITVFAAGLQKPRFLKFNRQGVLFVSLPGEGRVLALPDKDGDGRADRSVVFADGLNRPHGLDFYLGALFVAETGKVVSLRDLDGDLRADQKNIVSSDLPAGGGHWTRSLLADGHGSLYVSVGSDCNACLEEDPRRATVLKIPATGGRGRIFAFGLRNSVGLALDPVSGEIWASDNGRDLLGDDLPPDEINLLRDGGDYGWPYCYGRRVPDPELGSELRCRQTQPSEVDLPAHSAPLGITFGDGLRAAPWIRRSLLVAYHGSWNRTVPTGYKVVAIPFQQGRPAGPPRNLLRGWLVNERAWGRPVAPLVGPDGALYLSDDLAGVIYRIVLPRSQS
ncbi:PQQ-dependent sugar dehydrogenase [Geothermobacter hydrogeniphilus]|uniref:Pyrroloquinoline quinone-dependent pyranose dehydrogenase beta-propeller domain-containing protein n=1 Tax=Geothermobacter hydrogeniphilus TaxID=1969733 RepID=A0A1X0YEQ2_9BACT|nr:PQQ-dependent sugar dehydrogenase [Geothermobacter hydrogeniphilus]ORJ63607.1 hypothetical protein B5V00_01710 [Geothermobacter hydrogeniphilus]